MKTILIAIAGFLIISGTGVGAWLLTHKGTITSTINDAKNTATQQVTDAAKKIVLDQAQKFQPTGTCTSASTLARHKATGVEFTFPTSCVPDGWEKI